MMRLAAPAALSLAAAALALLGLWWLRRRWQRYPMSFGRRPGRNASALRGAATTFGGFLAVAAMVPLAVALARPQEVLSRTVESAQGVDMVIALDVSGSMAALDFEPSNRLGVAKEVIGQFLRGRPDDRFGLVVFAGAAVTLCPLTLDHDVAAALLDRVTLRALPDGTAIGLGVGTAVARLRSSDAESKVIVLVTDGASNAGPLDPMTAAELAAEQGVTVHTVLVGSGGVVPIPVLERDPRSGLERERVRRVQVDVNPELLADIARTTGGMSFRARDPKALVAVFAEIDAMEKTEFTSTRLVHHRERFEPWALAACLLMLAGLAVESVLGVTPW